MNINWNLVLSIIGILIIPVILYMIDVYVSLVSRKKHYGFRNNHQHDFTVLVPIYGNMKYLENADYLAQYGPQVTLLTTGGETKQFMILFKRVAKKYEFNTYVADWTAVQNPNKKSTYGTIRDRLIRDALSEVKTQYVVPLDADSITEQPLSIAVGELAEEKADIASVRLVLSNPDTTWLTKIQKLEYRISMDMRYVIPWLVSGACQVSKTTVLKQIMDKHSLFFQGNDVEIGLLAKRMGFKIVHIPFEVSTAVPSTIKPWFRQRLAWSAGEFRLFIVNFKFILWHPFFWIYGAIIVILTFPLRYLAISEQSISLLIIFALYCFLIYSMHWKYRNAWLAIMPIYTLFVSLVLVPLGIAWYVVMAVSGRNHGGINPSRTTKV